MSGIRFCFLFVCLLFGTSCQQSSKKLIALQPLGSFPQARAQKVLEQMRQHYEPIILLENEPIPEASFYPPRNRYRADSLIRIFKPKNKDTIVLLLINEDISTSTHGKLDWGIMGLAYTPGNSAIVSTHRLSAKNRDEQFYKVVLHELGHTQSLKHCPNKTCFMRDAEGGNPTDEETGFCTSCTYTLARKGWTLK